MARIVVTGGQGFLGSNLILDLVHSGEDVCATYNYTPPENTQRSKFLSHFRIDVTDFMQCRKLIMQENPTILYHLVAQPIVTAAVRDPLLTFDLTTRGTWNILEAVRQCGTNIKAIVFVSSDKVYGSNRFAYEQSPLAGTDHPYNVAKLAADVIAQSYVKTYGLPIVISRSANLYGPMDYHWDRLVPGTCRSIYEGVPLHVRSDGLQLRDYIHVTDGVMALRKMGEMLADGSILPGEIFNFGSKQMYSVLEVVDKLLGISGRIDLSPIVESGAKDEIDAQHISYTHAYNVLGWEPKIGLDEGLDRTFYWYMRFFNR